MTALAWRLKDSLVRYIEGPARGRIECSDGAERDAEHGFLFPCSSVADDHLQFEGAVVLAGHGGMLRVDLARPALTRHEAGWILSIEQGAQRIGLARVASFSPRSDAVLQGADTRLTAIGADLFAGQYERGTALEDPVVFL